MQNIIYPRAGKLNLFKFNPQGILEINSGSVVSNTGVVEKIESAIEIQTNALPDGNSDWDMGIYDTGTNGSVTVNMSSFNPKLYAALTGAEFNPGMVSAQMWSADEEHTIPDTSPYKVALEFAPASGGSIVIVDNESSPFVKVSGAPSYGQFSVSANEVTFSSADHGKPIFVTYDWTANKATNLALPTLASRPVYQAVISTEATDAEELKIYKANIVIDKCKADGSVSPPPQQRQAQGWSFTLKVLKPRNGFNPLYWRFADKN